MQTSFKTAKAEDQLKADEPKPCLHVHSVILKGATMQNANLMQPTVIELFCMKSSTLTLPSYFLQANRCIQCSIRTDLVPQTHS